MSQYFQTIHPAAMKKGFSESSIFYGLLIKELLLSYVNGFFYIQVVPPPANEIPDRFARSEQVFKDKLWRESLREWDENCKPDSIAKNKELQRINPDELSESELISYLKRCRDQHSAMIVQHFLFAPTAFIPIGDFLAHTSEWTKLPHSELLGLMRGASTLSAGQSDEMHALKQAFTNDTAARAILMSDEDPKEIFTKLCSLNGNTGNAINRYLELIGNRLLDGYDITEPTAIEMPDALLRSIRINVTEEAKSFTDIDSLTAQVRAQVPTEHQDEFDELLQEARLMYRLRDERGIYSDIWAAGIMRRAALSAGRRVANRGRIISPYHMLEATLDEMCALITNNDGPSAEELAKRADYRKSHTASEAPTTLGSPKPSPPDLTALPPASARIMRAFLTSISEIFDSAMTTQHEGPCLHGLAACKGIYEGPARRISSPAEFEQIVKGDVLITESTSEAFNIILPLLGGIVTDNGGLLSHAAIVAREYGIPGVVGTREATKRISNGMRVRVDGDTGEVKVIK
jgi:pyruvate,water dikinase